MLEPIFRCKDWFEGYAHMATPTAVYHLPKFPWCHSATSSLGACMHRSAELGERVAYYTYRIGRKQTGLHVNGRCEHVVGASGDPASTPTCTASRRCWMVPVRPSPLCLVNLRLLALYPICRSPTLYSLSPHHWMAHDRRRGQPPSSTNIIDCCCC
jgi:hypothetical protein